MVSKIEMPDANILSSVIWGEFVSSEFKDMLFKGCEELKLNPDYIMACIAFETGGTFDPKIKNIAGSNAVGLIQFMPDTAAYLGTSTLALMVMTAEEQH